MAATPNPLEYPSTNVSDVSMQTIQMCGLMVDVYGLAEVPPSATHISILWVHHPRLRSKSDMRPFACKTLSAWHNLSKESHPERGMIAAVWDQRNHGDRKVSELANETWRTGNKTHAQDMYGVVAGCVSDTQGLMDAIGGYLFLNETESVSGTRTRTIDQHLVVGVSLGGHTAWQLMFADERVDTGAMIIGCPDFMSLLQDRARRSKLPSFKTEDNGTSFLGSNAFPPALVTACKKADPKAIIFGTGAVTTTPKDSAEAAWWRALLDQHNLRGKRFLSCSGADDKLVPYSVSKPFMEFFTSASRDWYQDRGMKVEDKVYNGVGHSVSPVMLEDAVQFLTTSVRDREIRRLEPESKI